MTYLPRPACRPACGCESIHPRPVPDLFPFSGTRAASWTTTRGRWCNAPTPIRGYCGRRGASRRCENSTRVVPCSESCPVAGDMLRRNFVAEIHVYICTTTHHHCATATAIGRMGIRTSAICDGNTVLLIGRIRVSTAFYHSSHFHMPLMVHAEQGRMHQ